MGGTSATVARRAESCDAPTLTTIEDGRVALRRINVTVASCDRCDFRSGLTECLCDHWHECADGPYGPSVMCSATPAERRATATPDVGTARARHSH